MNGKAEEKGMMKKGSDCRRVREWMADAASGSLRERRHAEFESHVRNCAGCSAEFQRAQSVLQAIDAKLSASAAADPSPGLVANIRQAVANESIHQRRWWERRRWLVAAGTCAAMAILLLAIFSMHKRASRNVPRPAVASAQPPGSKIPPREYPKTESPEAARRQKPAVLVARRTSAHIRRQARQSELPQVIVEPDQMEAVMQFVAEVRQGKIDGAQIADEIKAAQQPIEIKPLSIAPLAAESSGRDGGAAGDSNGKQDFVSGKSDSGN